MLSVLELPRLQNRESVVNTFSLQYREGPSVYPQPAPPFCPLPRLTTLMMPDWRDAGVCGDDGNSFLLIHRVNLVLCDRD